MDVKKIKEQAEKEIEEEQFRAEVEKYKVKLKNKKTIWGRLFPYRIIIIKRGG